MQLIPVLDVMRGQAVHARRGERAQYAPLVSGLAPGHDPLDLARALVAASGSQDLYAADLDALRGQPVQTALWAALRDALPGVRIWLDAGWPGPGPARLWRSDLTGRAGTRGTVVLVYGSESLHAPEALEHAFEGEGADDVLSLDRGHPSLGDDARVWSRPACWPRQVIVMSLDRVGADGGPDLPSLTRAMSAAAALPGRRWFGAGGLRDTADLAAAAAAGAHGWLVASALHDGRLGPPAAGAIRGN